MNIRFAEKRDVKEIVKLCAEHAGFEQAEYDANNKQELLHYHLFESEYKLKCLIVEENDKIIGYSTFIKQFSTWDASYYLYLDCLYLKNTIRGKGIGTKLMNLIKDYAIEENCSVIQWQTPGFNKNAIKFYNKLGAKSKLKERFTLEIN